jgi:phosphonate transport system permease protein
VALSSNKNPNAGYEMKRTVIDAVTFAFLLFMLVIVLAQPSDETLQNVPLGAKLFGVLVVIGGLISVALNMFGIKTLGEVIFEPPHKKATGLQKPMLKTFWGWQTLVAFLVTFAVAIVKTRFSIVELLDKDGFEHAMNLFKGGLFSPNWHVLPEAIMNIIETIFMAFLATVLAIPFAFVLSFVSARNLIQGRGGYIFYMVLRTVMNVCRSIEAIIWAIIFSVWVGIGPFAGMLALMIHSIVSLMKQYSEYVEGIDEGPVEGIVSTGANRLQALNFAVIPQVVLPFISYTVYRWDTNVRMATIVGLVGGGGIGNMLMKYQGQGMWSEVGTIVIVIAVVVWIMDQASAYLREALK